MKTKISRMVGQLTIPFLIFCMLAISITAVQAAPSVSISPATTTVNKSDTFSVSIDINPDGNQVKGLDIILKFAPGSVQLGNVDIGSFLGSNPMVVFNDIDNTNGELELAYTVKPGNPAVTAAGTFATLNFTVKGNAPNGTTNLQLETVVLSDPNGVTIAGVAKNHGTVTVGGAPTNTAPVANNQAITTSEGTPVAVILTASDVDGDTLTYTVVSNPTHGTLSGTAPALTYTPDAGYNGTDSFTFKANDSALDSNIATVSITVTPVLPAALSVSILPATTTVNQSDTFSVNVVVNPMGKQVKGVDVILKFAPNAVQLDSVAIGSFLGSDPMTVLNSKDNTNGSLELAYTVKPGNPAVTTSGTFATLNFKVKGNAPVGTSNLHLDTVVLSDSDGMTISGVAKNDGTVTVGEPAPGSNLKWAFISVPYQLNNSTVAYVLNGIQYDGLFGFDPVNKVYVGGVTNFDPLKGYLIHMDISQDITNLVRKSGQPQMPSSLDVKKGWNLIGTTDTTARNAETMLGAIDPDYYSIWNFDVSTQSYDMVGINGKSGNIDAVHVGTDVFMMQPKVSYWVWATQDTSLPAYSP